MRITGKMLLAQLMIIAWATPAANAADSDFSSLAGTYEKFNHSSVTLLPKVISFSEFKGSATAEACIVGEVTRAGKKFIVECKAANKKEIKAAIADLEQQHVPWTGKPESLIKGKLEFVLYEKNKYIYFRGRKHVYAKFE